MARELRLEANCGHAFSPGGEYHEEFAAYPSGYPSSAGLDSSSEL